MSDTTLLRATAIGATLGFADIRLKLEGENPTGTHKDRAAAALVRSARRAGYRGVTVGTCGNLGVAIAHACRRVQLRCRVIAPRDYRSGRVRQMHELGAEVLTIEGTYEDAVQRSCDDAAESGYYDANPLGAAAERAMEAYGGIVTEVVRSLEGTTPATMWVPVGNGTTLAGIHRALRARGVSVRLGGVGSAGNNSATAAILSGRAQPLDPDALNPTVDNEPLVNWDSLQGAEAAAAIAACGGWGYAASDEELRNAARLLARVLNVHVPAYAAAGLAGFLAIDSSSLDHEGTHVIVLTARCQSGA